MRGVICWISRVEFRFAECFRMEEVMRVWRGVVFVREGGARGGG